MGDIKKEARIRVFNRWWWFYVILTAAVLLLVTLIGKNLNEDSRYSLVLILSIIELVILRIYKFSLKCNGECKINGRKIQ